MEFKMSDKSKKNWQNLMNELSVESQMTDEALIEKKVNFINLIISSFFI